jgi:hypothetical protein
MLWSGHMRPPARPVEPRNGGAWAQVPGALIFADRLRGSLGGCSISERHGTLLRCDLDWPVNSWRLVSRRADRRKHTPPRCRSASSAANRSCSSVQSITTGGASCAVLGTGLTGVLLAERLSRRERARSPWGIMSTWAQPTTSRVSRGTHSRRCRSTRNQMRSRSQG